MEVPGSSLMKLSGSMSDSLCVVERALKNDDFLEASKNLSLVFIVAEQRSLTQIEQAYRHLFSLFPHLTEDSYAFLAKNFQNLLNYSPLLAQQQEELAVKLADWVLRHSGTSIYNESMYYIASAIQIAKCHSRPNNYYHIFA